MPKCRICNLELPDSSFCKSQLDETNHICKKCFIDTYLKPHFKKERWVVLLHYGGDPPKCACCGETYYEFLAIDHINKRRGNPAERINGKGFYHWLIKNNFPKGFRVLCHNCNNALGFYGYCPHQTGKTEQKPNNLKLTIKTPNNWVGTPSNNRKEITFWFNSNSQTNVCKNCGGEFLKKGTHPNFSGFCRKKCQDEYNARKKVNF